MFQRLQIGSGKKNDFEKFTKDDKVIIILGACGSGKTKFINTATGENLLSVGDQLKVKTREVQSVKRNIPGLGGVILVDTPAIPEPNKYAPTPEAVEKELGKWLETAGKAMYGPKANQRAHVSGVIYLHRITDNKLTDPSFLHRGMLRTLCGDRYAKRTVLVTTMWEASGHSISGEKDTETQKQASMARKEKRETEIKAKRWESMEADGAPSIHRHDGSTASAREAIKVLLERDEVNQPIILLLGERAEDQQEFINEVFKSANISCNSELLANLTDSNVNSSTIFQNIPLAKRSAEDLQSIDTGDKKTINVAIITLPVADALQCSEELNRLKKLHGRDIITTLYIMNTTTQALSPVLLEALSLSLDCNVVIASRVNDMEIAIPADPVKPSDDGADISTKAQVFEEKWHEWRNGYTNEGETPALNSAPILEYGTGFDPLKVMSTIWRLYNE